MERFVSRKGKTTATADNVLLLPSSPSLPYDLVLMVVARVPRVYYRTLSLVSKSFRSMVASPELYKVSQSWASRRGVVSMCA